MHRVCDSRQSLRGFKKYIPSLTQEQVYEVGLSFLYHGGFGRHWLKNSVALSLSGGSDSSIYLKATHKSVFAHWSITLLPNQSTSPSTINQSIHMSSPQRWGWANPLHPRMEFL